MEYYYYAVKRADEEVIFLAVTTPVKSDLIDIVGRRKGTWRGSNSIYLKGRSFGVWANDYPEYAHHLNVILPNEFGYLDPISDDVIFEFGTNAPTDEQVAYVRKVCSDEFQLQMRKEYREICKEDSSRDPFDCYDNQFPEDPIKPEKGYWEYNSDKREYYFVSLEPKTVPLLKRLVAALKG